MAMTLQQVQQELNLNRKMYNDCYGRPGYEANVQQALTNIQYLENLLKQFHTGQSYGYAPNPNILPNTSVPVYNSQQDYRYAQQQQRMPQQQYMPIQQAFQPTGYQPVQQQVTTTSNNTSRYRRNSSSTTNYNNEVQQPNLPVEPVVKKKLPMPGSENSYLVENTVKVKEEDYGSDYYNIVLETDKLISPDINHVVETDNIKSKTTVYDNGYVFTVNSKTLVYPIKGYSSNKGWLELLDDVNIEGDNGVITPIYKTTNKFFTKVFNLATHVNYDPVTVTSLLEDYPELKTWMGNSNSSKVKSCKKAIDIIGNTLSNITIDKNGEEGKSVAIITIDLPEVILDKEYYNRFFSKDIKDYDTLNRKVLKVTDISSPLLYKMFNLTSQDSDVILLGIMDNGEVINHLVVKVGDGYLVSTEVF